MPFFSRLERNEQKRRNVNKIPFQPPRVLLLSKKLAVIPLTHRVEVGGGILGNLLAVEKVLEKELRLNTDTLLLLSC